jgi:hypothetical protein
LSIYLIIFTVVKFLSHTVGPKTQSWNILALLIGPLITGRSNFHIRDVFPKFWCNAPMVLQHFLTCCTSPVSHHVIFFIAFEELAEMLSLQEISRVSSGFEYCLAGSCA